MNSFASQATLTSGNRSYTIYRLPALTARGFNLSRLPFSLKILLENLLRREDGVNVTAATSSSWPTGTPRPSPAARLPTCRRAC